MPSTKPYTPHCGQQIMDSGAANQLQVMTYLTVGKIIIIITGVYVIATVCRMKWWDYWVHERDVVINST